MGILRKAGMVLALACAQAFPAAADAAQSRPGQRGTSCRSSARERLRRLARELRLSDGQEALVLAVMEETDAAVWDLENDERKNIRESLSESQRRIFDNLDLQVPSSTRKRPSTQRLTPVPGFGQTQGGGSRGGSRGGPGGGMPGGGMPGAQSPGRQDPGFGNLNTPRRNPCGDGVCDEFEQAHPNACPTDCGN